MEYGLYLATIIGAIALYMMMPRKGRSLGVIGMLLGAGTVGGLWLQLGQYLPAQLGIGSIGMGYYYMFSAIAIFAAVRVITHTKPIYSALWFVMTVLASSGLFLILDAEFMTFAMIIIYGGAILVTYMFVMMLASQSDDTEDNTDQQVSDYDQSAREPAAAVLVGFLLLASLLAVTFKPMQANPAAKMQSDATLIAQALPNRTAVRLEAKLGGPIAASLANRDHLENTERIGLDLFQSHPLGLELAGLILLIALIGAVVIAQKRNLLIEEELQEILAAKSANTSSES